MDVSPPTAPEQGVPEQAAPERRPQSANLHWPSFAAIILGAGLAVMVSGGGASALWGNTVGMFSPHRTSHTSASAADLELDRQGPQKQAEILLERAVTSSDAAADQSTAQIAAHIEAWRGKLKMDKQLGELTTVALNSNDRSLRASAIEVQLAAYGLTKRESTVDALVQQAGSSDHAQKIWALWTLGLLGNRGVETDRVVRVLVAHLLVPHLKDPSRNSDEDVRRWAVEGLALVGTTSTIVPLLNAMHDDPSPMVRERAACSLAESGMLTHDQRLAAVPQLINYSDDSALDAQTHTWAFQALADITKQRLPNDTAAWRAWYQTSVASGQ
jgi:HEAT repeat protein